MDINDIITQHKRDILSIGIIILSMVISNNIYKKQAAELQSIKDEISLENKKEGILSSINSSEQKINYYKKLIVKKDPGSGIGNFTELANKLQITIESIRPGKEQRYQYFTKITVNLSLVVSDYHALGEFLSGLESSQDIYIVETIDVKPQAKGGLSVNITLGNCLITI